MNTGIIYSRIVNKTNYKVYLDWNSTFVHQDNADSLGYSQESKKITKPGFYNMSTIEGYPWNDAPFEKAALLVFQYSVNFVVQIAICYNNSMLYTRIVKKDGTQVWREWATGDGRTVLKILALGDSICRGYRNNEKGFVGDLGHYYRNIGLSSATISNSRTDVTNIPDQLMNLTDYEPDIIIADGGVNDYQRNVPMGDIPTVPITTDEAAGALNRDTVMGGLQCLFYQMIAKYPKAQRFFLLTHKTTANLNSTVCDWTVTKNNAGYTQTELFDAIKKVCAIYGVKVIDVFGESMINTAFSQYKSTTAYNTDKSVTYTEFVDTDGIHPLDYGYLHGYVPLVNQAIQIGTHK